jgi:hypothetical protein
MVRLEGGQIEDETGRARRIRSAKVVGPLELNERRDSRTYVAVE